MLNTQPQTIDVSLVLHEINRRMQSLMPRLTSANQACAEAALPLAHLAEMNPAQKREVAARIRAAEQEWEQVTHLVNQLIAEAAVLSSQSPPSSVGKGGQ
jgi:hypothetical protein